MYTSDNYHLFHLSTTKPSGLDHLVHPASADLSIIQESRCQLASAGLSIIQESQRRPASAGLSIT